LLTEPAVERAAAGGTRLETGGTLAAKNDDAPDLSGASSSVRELRPW
jgi:hypothetical protein